ncbi:DUF1801 domain-containing protein [Polaribacter dokdonensis]|jgi:hypothetical protein|uniref:DUF5655 domain-containing protein n=1 Tax=Polaribacter dokdonensis DSW-5 TaxID=1300348 RepID=A0A0M9CED3_9FLAO|nr:DUF1801 domain-containing protein [Polaribacter dokdonensis]KOY50941.1 hypothetical protein I602_501 [Polaribacter dokdonensis DSW-5]SEE22339.1 hypothetical protein SAMN05444353_1284 [Polaribacter dokdonensis DSW-5]
MKPAENYILDQPEPYKSILMHLQILIESTFPEVDLQFKWNIPFYYLEQKPFCYLNPSKKKGYVDVAFWASAHLTKYNEHLISENRKVVKSLRYYKLEDINEEILLTVLKEAHQLKGKGFYKKKD